jgi:hypothetical protein
MYHNYGEVVFTNKYGTLVVVPVTKVLAVRDIHGEDIPDEYKFDLPQAEQIALLTENDHAQIALQTWTADSLGYLIVHTSCSSAFVVRIKTLEYTGPDARDDKQTPCRGVARHGVVLN